MVEIKDVKFKAKMERYIISVDGKEEEWDIFYDEKGRLSHIWINDEKEIRGKHIRTILELMNKGIIRGVLD